MKYMVLIADAEEKWGDMSPEDRQAAYERIEAWWGEHAAAGEIVEGHELQSTSTATTVRRDASGAVSVTDGPFMEAKEAVGGYAVIDVPDLDAAIRMVSGWPSEAALEIRPVVDSRE